MKSDTKIIFMGTPEFAAHSLRELIENKYNIQAVVTAVDKPSGRGQKIHYSAVKKTATELNIPVLQPENLKSEEFINQLKKFNPDVFIVVAFRMIPRAVFDIPRLGTFNLHASLLPNYRGAAPINWAIINGENITGVTTFLIDDKIDTGNILLQKECSISTEDTAGTLHDKLMVLGAETIMETVDKLSSESISPKPQQTEGVALKSAPKIYKEDCLIQWEKPLEKTHHLVKGMSPYPTSFTHIKFNGKSKKVKIFNGTPKYFVHTNTDDCPKIIVDKKELKIKTTEGYYIITELQVEGKKKMTTSDFINGNNTTLILSK